MRLDDTFAVPIISPSITWENAGLIKQACFKGPSVCLFFRASKTKKPFSGSMSVRI